MPSFVVGCGDVTPLLFFFVESIRYIAQEHSKCPVDSEGSHGGGHGGNGSRRQVATRGDFGDQDLPNLMTP